MVRNGCQIWDSSLSSNFSHFSNPNPTPEYKEQSLTWLNNVFKNFKSQIKPLTL